MKFSNALEEMAKNNKVQRSGWNGKGMFIFMICGNRWDFTVDVEGVNDMDTLPFYCMKTADNKLVPWLASQTDIIADDWQVVL